MAGTDFDSQAHIGERFDRLVIDRYVGIDKFGRKMFHCKCDCGGETTTAYTALKNGHTHSCGCYNRDQSSADHTSRIGQRYGRLTILDFDHKNEGGKLFYRCKCDCGNEKVVRYDSLKSGAIQSCGCLNREKHSKDSNEHVGEVWGRYTIIAYDHTDGSYNKYYLCRCQCGNERIVPYSSLKTGDAKSCGCLSREVHTKHGMSHERIYRIWRGIRDRCNISSDQKYPNYGGRGIKVCKEWNDPETGFQAFYDWSMSHGYAKDLSIDRKDNDGNYEPANCRWTTSSVQMNNTRFNVYVGYRLAKDSDPQYLVFTYAEWTKILNVNYNTFRTRILAHDDEGVNTIIEQCYREGHGMTADEPFEMKIDDEVLAQNHIDRLFDAICDS